MLKRYTFGFGAKVSMQPPYFFSGSFFHSFYFSVFLPLSAHLPQSSALRKLRCRSLEKMALLMRTHRKSTRLKNSLVKRVTVLRHLCVSCLMLWVELGSARHP